MSSSPDADFSRIRYAQCWEDADVLLEGLDPQPGEACLSIASAGDNTLALLLCDPASVTAVDLSPAQIHCLQLRIAAYRSLSHPELLELIGSRPSDQRETLYQRCRDSLPAESRTFWDARQPELRQGLGAIGKFERYFRLFRRVALPLVHSRRRIHDLLTPREPEGRARFYDEHWDTRRWRWLFRLFFSRFVMARLGRDPAFFKYVEGSVADRILARTRHALRELSPSENPYLHWILTGTHGHALPLALRAEHFDTLRDRIDRIRIVQGSLESALDRRYDRVNLSDIFEYLSEGQSACLLDTLCEHLNPGGRLFYWNMLAPRHSSPKRHPLRSLDALGDTLLQKDKAWFYSRIVVEQKLP